MLIILTMVAQALLVIVSVGGIGLCCGTAFVCFSCLKVVDARQRAVLAAYGTLSVFLTGGFTWMLLNLPR